jgi:hypothetical protein
MTEVLIEFLVPHGVQPLVHRDECEARAVALGWPVAHSGGTLLSHVQSGGHCVVDLQWSLDVDPAPVVAVLRDEFYVRRVHVRGET